MKPTDPLALERLLRRVRRLEAQVLAMQGQRRDASSRPALVDAIVQMVAREYRLNPAVILSANRMQTVCEARHTAVYLMRTVGKLSHPEIAGTLGRRHHGVSLHSQTVAMDMIQSYPEFKARVERMQAELSKNFKSLLS